MDEYLEKFLEDVTDLLATLEHTLLSLEKAPQSSDLVEEIFRVMHTIKGAANMFGFSNIGNFTHQLETIYDAVREKKAEVNAEIIELTFQGVDHVGRLLEDPEIKGQENLKRHQDLSQKTSIIISEITQEAGSIQSEEKQVEQSGDKDKISTYYLQVRPVAETAVQEDSTILYLMDDMHDLGKMKVSSHVYQQSSSEGKENQQCYCYWDIYLSTREDEQYIRDFFIFVEHQYIIEVHKIAETNLFETQQFVEKIESISQLHEPVNPEQLQTYAKELLAKNNEQNASLQKDEEETLVETVPKKKSENLRVSREKVNQMMNWVSELVTMQGTLKMLSHTHSIPELTATTENLEIITNNLRDTVFSISLVPVETLLVRFHRLVRDLSQKMGKKVNFEAEGVDTELDKNIIEQLADPLLHVLRNSIDHGLEAPQEREVAGKSPEGKILLKSFYSGGYVFIQITDDGRGIDVENIRKKAIEKGILDKDAPITEQESLQLIFAPGFSTASSVTDVSGRGVGMDVVRKKIEEMRGEVEISTELGNGTSITIKLPLTLSIIEGLLVRIHQLYMIIPLEFVQRCYKIPYKKLLNSGQFSTALVIDDKQIPCINLRDKFHIDQAPPDTATIVSVLHQQDEKGLAVDAVLGNQQAVLKPLGEMYQEQDFISGVSVLGDGTLALVLDTNRLINQYTGNQLVTER